MRTIEFRVWDQDLGVMITPSNSDQFAIGLSGELIDVGCVFTSQIKNISKGVVVEQFTGLLDKNGTKIFEGDKLSQINRKEVFTVVWLDGEPVSLREIGEPLNSQVIKHYSLIVIGNIHEAK